MGFQHPTNYLKLSKEVLSEDEISCEMTNQSQSQNEHKKIGLGLKPKTATATLDRN